VLRVDQRAVHVEEDGVEGVERGERLGHGWVDQGAEPFAVARCGQCRTGGAQEG
jgi:hypothetical protein